MAARTTLTKTKATVVVGLDFGTTFSGFAYALASQPDRIHKFYDWPAANAAGVPNYCKTQTSLLYAAGAERGSGADSKYILQAWGYEALVQHTRGFQSHNTQQKQIINSSNRSNRNQCITNNSLGTFGHFISRFKLHLAGSGPSPGGRSPETCKTSAADLPDGLTPRRTISDYLRKLSELIIVVIQSTFGNHISMEDIQWCITVPAIWNESAKQEMKTCAEMAGMVQGPHCEEEDASPHPVIIVLEPEAASLYCQQKAELSLTAGDKFLVVDVGGGTVDLVLHEKVGALASMKVREVAPSSGGLCGGTYVDENFFKFLCQKIRCFQNFAQDQPQTVLKLQAWWEPIKRSFDGKMRFDYELELPAKLASAWEEDDCTRNVRSNETYDSIDLSLTDMLSIFDPIVEKILELIDEKMVPELKSMMIVGGFSASPYLTERIRMAFSKKMPNGSIVIPTEPSSAICCGAVGYGVGGAHHILSRISKKTYGLDTSRPFRQGDPDHMMMRGEYGQRLCTDVFGVFTRKGEDVPLNKSVSQTFRPLFSHQTKIRISMFSSSETDPAYVTDAGVIKEGSFVVVHPSKNTLGIFPKITVSMYFGRAVIEVTAVGENFGDGEHYTMPPVVFET